MRKGGLYLAVGDSITAGVSGTVSSLTPAIYSHRIWDAIRSNYGFVRHLNKGSTGWTTTNAITSASWWLPATEGAGLITLLLGSNDGAALAVPVVTYTANLTTLVGLMKKQSPSATIILCGIPNTTQANLVDNAAAYRTAASGVATATDVAYCDLSTAWITADNATYLASDGLHPKLAGHEKMYDVLWPVVQSEAATWLATLG